MKKTIFIVALALIYLLSIAVGINLNDNIC